MPQAQLFLLAKPSINPAKCGPTGDTKARRALDLDHENNEDQAHENDDDDGCGDYGSHTGHVGDAVFDLARP